MSHFTLLSGVQTDTVSLRCPTCRRRRTFPADRWWSLQRASYVRALDLYCSAACREVHCSTILSTIARMAPHSTLAPALVVRLVTDGLLPEAIAETLVNDWV